MDKLLFILGLILIIPALIILITIPMDIENEINFETQEIATVDVITVHWMFGACFLIGIFLIAGSFKFTLQEKEI